MRRLKIRWVIPVMGMVVSSCEDPPPGTEDPVISETLEGVAEILTGDGSPTPPVEPPAPVPPEEGEPVIPTAKPVPDKPGFVISPYNGKWIDVTGIPAGSTAADPDFPAEEKKYFIVPEPLPVPVPPADPAPPTEGAGEEPAEGASEPEASADDANSTV